MSDQKSAGLGRNGLRNVNVSIALIEGIEKYGVPTTRSNRDEMLDILALFESDEY